MRLIRAHFKKIRYKFRIFLNINPAKCWTATMFVSVYMKHRHVMGIAILQYFPKRRAPDKRAHTCAVFIVFVGDHVQ